MADDVDAAWYHFLAVGGEWRIQRSVKCLTSVVLLAVDGIDQANRKLRSLIDDELLRSGRRRRYDGLRGLRRRGDCGSGIAGGLSRSEEHTSELQSLRHL